MVSTNFVVGRCENTSFRGGGGEWKRFLSEIYITSPDHLYCIILLLNCSASPQVLSILCVFFCFSLIRSEIDKPLGFDRDFDI